MACGDIWQRIGETSLQVTNIKTGAVTQVLSAPVGAVIQTGPACWIATMTDEGSFHLTQVGETCVGTLTLDLPSTPFDLGDTTWIRDGDGDAAGLRQIDPVSGETIGDRWELPSDSPIYAAGQLWSADTLGEQLQRIDMPLTPLANPSPLPAFQCGGPSTPTAAPTPSPTPVPPMRTMSGRVTDVQGKGLAGINLLAISRSQFASERRFVTNAQGEFSGTLPADIYVLKVADPTNAHGSGCLGDSGFSYDTLQQPCRILDLWPADVSNLQIALPPAIHATFHLTSATGAPLQGLNCSIGLSDLRSDANGDCSFVVNPGDLVSIRVFDPTGKYLDGYSTATGFTHDPNLRVFFTVTDAGLRFTMAIPLVNTATPSPTASPTRPPTPTPTARPTPTAHPTPSPAPSTPRPTPTSQPSATPS